MSSDYDAAVETLYQAAAEPERWSEALAMLGRYAGADGAMLISANGMKNSVTRAPVLILPFATPCGEISGIGLIAPVEATTARLRLERMLGHVARALELSLQIARARVQVHNAETVKNLLPTAAFWLDRDARIIEANMLGVALLDEGDGLVRDAQNRLAAEIGYEAERLRMEIRLALTGRNSAQHAVKVERPTGRAPLLVLITALAGTPNNEVPCLLVQAVCGAERHGKESVLRNAYRLTASEARVAVLAASGHSAPMAAATLGVTANTIRTHLARVFDKTGARSQRALAQLLSAFPPLEPA